MIQINQINFLSDIENIVYKKDVAYIDAVIDWVSANNFDFDFAAELVKKSPAIQEKIRMEAESLHFLPKQRRLPI